MAEAGRSSSCAALRQPVDPIAAEIIASHALIALLLLIMIGSALSALTWHAILKLGPPMWTAVSRVWARYGGEQALVRVGSWRYLGPAFNGTLSAAKFLGIYAVCSFAVALVAFGAFVELADALDVDETLWRFDHALSDALRRHLSDGVLRALSILTHLGDFAVLAAVSVAIALALFLQHRRRLAAACLVATAGGGTLTSALKHYFARVRPLHDHPFTPVDGYSFPSGHASGSMLVYGLLCYLIVRHTTSRWHIPVVVFTVAVIVLVGASRVLLQVHFVSDVAAGWANSAAWLALWIAGLEALRWRTANRSEV